jgi:5-methylcytosine-specific restriction endonuclease McrA
MTVEPKTAELSRLHITVPHRLLWKLEAARAALSHSHPGASAGEVLEVGLDLIIERHARRRGLVERPRTPRHAPSAPRPARRERDDAARGKATDVAPGRATDVVQGKAADPARAGRRKVTRGERNRRHIPAHVKRAVWERDEARCQWPLDGGGVCGSTHRLELDHVVPLARGGPSKAGNLRLLCDFHNQLAARRIFGDACVDRHAARRRAGRSDPGSSP